MMLRSFRGGIFPDEKKELAENSALQVLEPAGDLVFPLSQHIGAPAKAIVKRGDPVLVGQKIAEAGGFVSACICSSVSGKVKAVEKRPTVGGNSVMSVVITNDGQYTAAPGVGEPCPDVSKLTKDEILARIKEAGIVGMGGAGFPTAVKLAPKNPLAIRHVIVNGAECEPYITCDDRLMLEHSDDILKGLALMLRLFPNAEGVILIENNKPEAIQVIKGAIQEFESSKFHEEHKGFAGSIRLQVAPTKYPQGGERSIIKVVTGIDLKASMLPADAGCIVDNAATVYAIYDAVYNNMPLIRRCVTVSGEAVVNPSNFIVRLGTNQSEIVEAAGGVKEGVEVKKALSGGPMMGIAMSSLDVPLQKGNNAITLLPEDGAEQSVNQLTACIRCGRCNRACPLGLVPQMMQVAAEHKDYETYEKKLYGLECIACGSCTYVCPAKRPLMQLFKTTKGEIMAQKRALRAKAQAEELKKKEQAPQANGKEAK